MITSVAATERRASIVFSTLLYTHWVMGLIRKHPSYIQYLIEEVYREDRGEQRTLTFKERHLMICCT